MEQGDLDRRLRDAIGGGLKSGSKRFERGGSDGRASFSEAEEATRATLTTLGDYLAGGEGPDLASQLPQGLAEHLRRQPPERADLFSINDFLQEVGEREGVNTDEASAHSRAIVSVLQEAVSEGEMVGRPAATPERVRPPFRLIARFSLAGRGCAQLVRCGDIEGAKSREGERVRREPLRLTDRALSGYHVIAMVRVLFVCMGNICMLIQKHTATELRVRSLLIDGTPEVRLERWVTG